MATATAPRPEGENPGHVEPRRGCRRGSFVRHGRHRPVPEYAAITTGPLSTAQLRDAISAADAAALMLLGLRTDPDPDRDAAWDQSWSKRAEIHQATGMIVAQLRISPTDAFARLRAYAFTQNVSLGDVARAVVARRVQFTKDT